jgi:isocitrate lyase
MFQLDDKFLQDVGLSDLPEDQKQAFLQHIYSELELRVGTKLSEGMNEDQLAQFEAFVDQDEQKVTMWFERYVPNYREAADFQSLKASAPQGISDIALLSEYGSLKWLEMNRPDYKQIVASELESLKTEITQNRDSILGSAA